MQVNIKQKLTIKQKLEILHYTKHQFIYSSISEKELAEEIGISPRDLRAIYQKFLGETPKNYITKVKMAKARTLLRITEESIIDIALLLGYENPSHMSAKFKELYSLTPSSYRRMNFLMAS